MTLRGRLINDFQQAEGWRKVPILVAWMIGELFYVASLFTMALIVVFGAFWFLANQASPVPIGFWTFLELMVF